MKEESTKDDTFFKICNSVMKMEVSKGHLCWRLSDVAKDAEVTRSLIYYYFGKEKEVILEEAFRYMIDIFFNLERKDSTTIQERMKYVIDNIRSMPYIFVLFYLQKDSEGQVGELIRKAESQLLKILATDYPEKSREDILKLYILELGCVAYSRLSDDDLMYMFNSEEIQRD